MGNTNHKQNTFTAAAMYNTMPGNKDDKSRILNQMLIKVIKKLENPKYLANVDQNFVPKIIELDNADYQCNYQSDGTQNSYENTQKLYSLAESQLTLSTNGSKIAQNCMVNDHSPNLVDKENKGILSAHDNSMNILDPPKQKRYDSNQLNKQNKNSKFFLSQNKLTSLSNNGLLKGSNIENNRNYPNSNLSARSVNNISEAKNNNLSKLSMSSNRNYPPYMPDQIVSPLNTLSQGSRGGTVAEFSALKNDGLINPAIHDEVFGYTTTRTGSNNNGNFGVSNMLSPSNINDDNEAPGLTDTLKKIVQKKKLFINCSLEKNLFLLPSEILFTILTFVLDDYINLILVSPLWYYKINEVFDSTLVTIDNSFIKSYMSILSFKRSYFSIKLFKLSDKVGIRMDRNIIAEPLYSLLGIY